MSVYLVTGGAGFIGSNIVEELVNQGSKVRVLDNLSTGKRENLDAFKGKIEMIELDICDLNELCKAMQGAEIVFHQAAIPSVPRSIEDPITSHNADLTGTLHVLWAAKKAGVKRVIYAASSSAYGDSQVLPKREDHPAKAISPYGLMKFAGEEYCRLFSALYGLETVSLRYFNVFGPRQDPSSQYSGVLSRFITAMLRGQSPTIHGDGEQSRDFTYVENVVRGNLLAAQAKGATGKMYNVACGQSVTLNQVVKSLNNLLGTNIPSNFGPPRTGDIRHSLADISRAAHDLNYSPVVQFEAGLKLTVDWYRTKLSVK
ncbi:MAG: SDR family oxidoreductase [Terriglobia bacterium]